MERAFSKYHHQIHSSALVLAVLGLVLHILFESAVIGVMPINATNQALIISVVAHRLVVGLTIWLLCKPYFGFLGSSLAVLFAIIMSLAGVYLGSALNVDEVVVWVVQALLLGSVLHVVFFRFHDLQSSCCGKKPSAQFGSYEGAGNLIGIFFLILFFVFNPVSEGTHHHGDASFLQTVYQLSLLSAAPSVSYTHLTLPTKA